MIFVFFKINQLNSLDGQLSRSFFYINTETKYFHFEYISTCNILDPSDYDAYDDEIPTPAPRKLRKGQNQEEEEFFSRPVVPKWERQAYSCDLQSDLYLLQQEKFIKGDDIAEGARNCSR